MGPDRRVASGLARGLRAAAWVVAASLPLGCARASPAVGAGSAPPPASGTAAHPLLARMSWLAGCWERASEGGSLEEQWMRPRGGIMLGMSRTVREGRAVAHEALRIEARGERLVYVADPSGQALTEFTSVEVTDTSAAWENPDHDFPQRILYRRGPADSLFARAEGERDGVVRGADFRLARVACRGP